jgi:hypothetical protein
LEEVRKRGKKEEQGAKKQRREVLCDTAISEEAEGKVKGLQTIEERDSRPVISSCTRLSI